MRRASITEVKNQLSALIDEVRNGDTVLILDRGRPVARLESAVAGSESDADGRIARLERQGLVRRGAIPQGKPRLPKRLPRAKDGASLLKALLEERREGR